MGTPGSSKAAEIAARQVQAIVEAAQNAAEQITQRAEDEIVARRAELEAEFEKRRVESEADIERRRAKAESDAEKVRSSAEAEAKRRREHAEEEAKRINETARREAADRVAAAGQAADEALADARAMHAGLRRLGESLSDYAERILRDVQAGHKRLRNDLRIASGYSPSPSRSDSARRTTRPDGEGALDEIDIPEWVAGEE
jgi:hypothetical protein